MEDFNKFDNSEEIENDLAEELDETEFSEDVDDEEQTAPAIVVKAQELYNIAADKASQIYTDPAESSRISKKTAWIVTAACSVFFILLAVGSYFFLTSYDYYTTGITVKEFIKAFNSVECASDSDLIAIFPSYTDIVIPEDAKLGGDNEIELMDGHIIISAETRFGKIKKLNVRAVDYPNYDPMTCKFYVDEGDYSFLNYYICFGKCLAAYRDLPEVYEAALYAFQFHQYAFQYLSYGEDGSFTANIDDNAATYTLIYNGNTLVVEPLKDTITTAVWPEIFDKKDPAPVIDESIISDETASASDVVSNADSVN